MQPMLLLLRVLPRYYPSSSSFYTASLILYAAAFLPALVCNILYLLSIHGKASVKHLERVALGCSCASASDNSFVLMQLWPKIAAHFHMESGPNLHISLDTVMNTPEKKDIWAKTVKVIDSSTLHFFANESCVCLRKANRISCAVVAGHFVTVKAQMCFGDVSTTPRVNVSEVCHSSSLLIMQ